MPRAIILDTFAVGCVGKSRQIPPGATDLCRDWVFDCVAQGNAVHIPEISYYEALRELERRGATVQIKKLRGFCHAETYRFLAIDSAQIESAARLWAQARNQGLSTASQDSLDGDMILVAQTLSLGFAASDYVIATTNVNHLSPFASADHWKNIAPGS
jgi:predicted nucleic acid-binding protein